MSDKRDFPDLSRAKVEMLQDSEGNEVTALVRYTGNDEITLEYYLHGEENPKRAYIRVSGELAFEALENMLRLFYQSLTDKELDKILLIQEKNVTP